MRSSAALVGSRVVPAPGELTPVHGGGSRSSCRFCGLEAGKLAGALSSQRRSVRRDAGQCRVVLRVMHLARTSCIAEIELEATLIWPAGIDARRIERLGRGIHLILVQHGKPPHVDGVPSRQPLPLLPPSAVMALKERGAAPMSGLARHHREPSATRCCGCHQRTMGAAKRFLPGPGYCR